ncbi:uncharacterized protein [Diadema setosum]|uniref:uncharacterized protein n=1 Tax=Diadema setosum TaxID=31175 RepID=UPI003B3B4664
MEEDEYGSRRPRSRNWNTAEKFFLFEHVKNRFDIITDPRKEAASIHEKRRIWEQIYQAIAKEFGPLEDHLVRGKGGEKCRTQWKNLVQAARKEYKQYMEAKMVGKRHNMTLLSRKICRLMSIDLDDGLGDQDNEENDWTEDHPEFRYQPELCQELKEMARRINNDYAQGFYDNPSTEDVLMEYEELETFEGEVVSESETEQPDDAKDEDYAPSRRSGARKRRRTSSGRSGKGAQPTRTSARALAAQAKKAEAEKQARKQKSVQEEIDPPANIQSGCVITGLSEQNQQEILNLYLVEHRKRTAMMTTEHKNKMQLLKLEKDILALQKEYWSQKLEVLNESGRHKDIGDEDEEDDEEAEESGMLSSEAEASGASASASVVVPPPTEHPTNPSSQCPAVGAINGPPKPEASKSRGESPDGNPQAEAAAVHSPKNFTGSEAQAQDAHSAPEGSDVDTPGSGLQQSHAPTERYTSSPPVCYQAASQESYHSIQP